MTWNCGLLLLVLIISYIAQITKALTCKCENNDDCPNFNSKLLTCEISDGAAFCYSALNYTYDSHDEIFRENRWKGCGYLENYANKCTKTLEDIHRPTHTQCCGEENCNSNLTPHIDEIDDVDYFNKSFQKYTRWNTKNLVIVVGGVVGIVGITVTCIVIYLFMYKWKSQKNSWDDFEKGSLVRGWESYSADGSGRGGALIIQRTLGQDLVYQELIGEGSYGTVHKGLFKELPVAIKITGSLNEQSYFNEIGIYSSSFLHHENILRFISGDIVQLNYCTYYVMIFEYHHNGSLYEFLKANFIEREIVVKMVRSLSFGLDHLHLEYQSSNGNKYSIAHRDLKSRNILVKSNLECCIADFGLSVMNRDDQLSRKGVQVLVGTKRYMAPELLDDSLNPYNFPELLRADIYSFALILWEILNSYVEEVFRLPYFDCVSPDPSIEEMREAVCRRELRPIIDAEKLGEDPILDELYQAMSEFWSSNPDVRNTALYVRKRIQRILQKETDTGPENRIS